MTDDPPFIKFVRVGLSLLANPSQIPIYLSTLHRKPIDVGLPWINLNAICFLEKFLRADMIVFEYGSGGSTIFFAKRCRHIVSIEDNREWVLTVCNKLHRLCLTNTSIQFHDAGSVYSSSSAQFRESSYLHAIDELDPDVVLIDGADEWQAYGRESYQTRRS